MPRAARSATSTRASWTRPASTRSAPSPSPANCRPSTRSPTRTSSAATLAHLGRIGVGVPLGVSIGQDDRDSSRYVPSLWQGGLGLPDRDYYLKADDAAFAKVRAGYVDFLTTLLTLAGEKDARATAASVLALETELARLQWTQVEVRDPVKTYNRFDIVALPALSPDFAWADFMSAAGLAGPGLAAGAVPDVLVGQPSYVAALGALTRSVPLATWQAYARTHLLTTYAPFLDKAFVDASFAFNGTVLSGTLQQTPRWRRGVRARRSIAGRKPRPALRRGLLPAAGQEEDARPWSAISSPPAGTSIAGLDWMGPQTPGRRLRQAGQDRRSRSAIRTACATTRA